MQKKNRRGTSRFQRKLTNKRQYIFIRNLIKTNVQTGEHLIVPFIDLKAAFDTVQQQTIDSKLLEIPDYTISVVDNIYGKVKARVQLNGEKSKEFYRTKGIKQGDRRLADY